MSLEYSITYKAENTYEQWVNDAHWQFLILPEENSSQELITTDFTNSLNAINEHSINGYGFQTIRVHPKKKFKQITFEATCKVIKKEVNPFDFSLDQHIPNTYAHIEAIDFKVVNESFLRKTRFTTIPETNADLFCFDRTKSIFENLQALNEWTFKHIFFKTGVTDVNTSLDEIIEKRHGVCQDFTHLFCALARQNGIPARYVSGYLHQGNGYFGDSQMHAWAEVFVPNLGWIGFDSTNNLIANENHIKVAHGKDYFDCPPIKGVVFTTGSNETRHSVVVASQQQQ